MVLAKLQITQAAPRFLALIRNRVLEINIVTIPVKVIGFLYRYAVTVRPGKRHAQNILTFLQDIGLRRALQIGQVRRALTLRVDESTGYYIL